MSKVAEKAVLASSFGSGSDSLTGTASDPEVRFAQRTKKVKIVDRNVAMALDRTATSSSSAMRILSTAAKQWGTNLQDVSRQKERSAVAETTVRDFNPSDYLTVHCDGKRMSEN